MAKHPAMPFWTDAYLGDTHHLTTIEHGAYILLLITMWRAKDKTLPDDDIKMCRYTKLSMRQWVKIKPTIYEFFEVRDGKLHQKKLEEVAQSVEEFQNRQSKNGSAKWLKNNKTGDATAMPNRCQKDANSNSNNKIPTLEETPNTGPHAPAREAAAPVVGSIEQAEYVKLGKELAQVANLNPARPWDYTPVKDWLAAGASPELIRETVMRLARSPTSPIASLRYFNNAIIDATRQQKQIEEQMKGQGNVKAIEADTGTSKSVVDRAKKRLEQRDRERLALLGEDASALLPAVPG